MSFGTPNPTSGNNGLDYGSLLAGLSAAGFTAMMPRFYRSVRGKQPSRFLAMLAPPFCGSIALVSWHYLVSRPIKTKKLNCAACASIRGSLLLVLNGCLLPSFAVALLHFRRNTGLQQHVVEAFLDFCYSPYYGRSKPYIIALVVFQAVLGYGMASWIYTEEFIKSRNSKKKL